MATRNTSHGLDELNELAIDQLADYPTDCGALKQIVIRQQFQLSNLIEDAKNKGDDCGKADLIQSQQELRLAEAEFQKALKAYQKDCGRQYRKGAIW